MKLSISSEKMQTGADMALDDIIKKKKALKTGGRGGQARRGQGQRRGGNLRGTRGGGVNKQNRRPMQGQRNRGGAARGRGGMRRVS